MASGPRVTARLGTSVDGNPGIVLIAPQEALPEQFEVLETALRREGYATLSFSLPPNAFAEAGAVAPAIHALLDQAVNALQSAGVPASEIALAGMGPAATVAASYAAEHPGIAGLILISPGLREQGIALELLFDRVDDRPVFLAAADNDAYTASSAQTLKAQSDGFCELRLFPGSAQGLDLFSSHPNAIQQLLQWLHTSLPLPGEKP
ncbi:MAG: hypothetical protein HYV27_06765 [Candidatus Hydrogenedentes bacterium]|nr:hypothetical protein [Candidatus Hydrogenedentota bacterium]